MKKVERIKCKCHTCNKDIEVMHWRFKKTTFNFCSRECYWEDRKDPKYTEAARAKMLDNNKLGLNNPKGEDAYNWKGGKNKCIDCGKLLCNRESKRCSSCHMKKQQKLKGAMPIRDLICNFCGKEFQNKAVNIGKNGIHYCSKECLAAGTSIRLRGITTSKEAVIPKYLFQQLRQSFFYADWRKACFIRDNYKCQHCGLKGSLHVHHKISVKDLIFKYNIHTENESWDIPEFWDINNGVTLCPECHREEHRRLKQMKLIKEKEALYVVS